MALIGVACPKCWLPIRKLFEDMKNGCICPDRAERFSDLSIEVIEQALGIPIIEISEEERNRLYKERVD